MSKSNRPYTRGGALATMLQQRIAIIDGAMGTMIQRYKLTEADYRGAALRRPSARTSRATTNCCS